ncbi:hypothetical protein SDC9_193265 [bioreactor metagenome]|uniref:Uncharacterized protein n=1 Tax=bioreactor metagenome TaxID=1076179 RepID=A0A645I4A6_9ZZZZ
MYSFLTYIIFHKLTICYGREYYLPVKFRIIHTAGKGHGIQSPQAAFPVLIALISSHCLNNRHIYIFKNTLVNNFAAVSRVGEYTLRISHGIYNCIHLAYAIHLKYIFYHPPEALASYGEVRCRR